MKWILALALLLSQDAPRLYVVPARDEVYVGQVFTVTVLAFGEVGPVSFDPGSFAVLTDTLSIPTRHVWLRATGPARDVRVTVRAGALSDEAIIRICCRASSIPPVYLPTVLYTGAAQLEDTRLFLPVLQAN